MTKWSLVNKMCMYCSCCSIKSFRAVYIEQNDFLKQLIRESTTMPAILYSITALIVTLGCIVTSQTGMALKELCKHHTFHLQLCAFGESTIMLTLAYLINEVCGYIHKKLLKVEDTPWSLTPQEPRDGGADRTQSGELQRNIEASLEELQQTDAENEDKNINQHVMIRVNGVQLRAHKDILASYSSYFRTLLSSSWSSSVKKEFTVPGVSQEMMELVIRYMYTKSVCITEENVEMLLEVADYLMVEDLVQDCCSFLQNQLSPENCIGIWFFAEWYSCVDLQQSAKLFLLHHFEQVVAESQEFKMLSLPQLIDIIEKDELNVKHEETVFEAILHWISLDPQEREAHITTLLPKVRMGRLEVEYIRNILRNNVVVRDSNECKSLILSALETIYYLTKSGTSSSNLQHQLIRPRLPQSVLLAIGGRTGAIPSNSFEAYDVRADRWETVMHDEQIGQPCNGAVFLNGFVYCLGGYINQRYSSSTRMFDPITRTWHQMASMLSLRYFFSVCVMDGCIYAVGGLDGLIWHSSAERYDPDTNQWSYIASMNERRSQASATSLHNRVYICGGYNSTGYLFTAECYNPETDQWSFIEPMKNRRCGLGVITYRDQVYAVGGFNGSTSLKCVEVFNPLSSAWRDLPNMLQHRSHFGIEVLEDQLFVVGGADGFNNFSGVEYYDEDSNEWNSATNMAIPRSGLSCCVISGIPNIRDYVTPRDHGPHRE